jgi:hypothetical protein
MQFKILTNSFEFFHILSIPIIIVNPINLKDIIDLYNLLGKSRILYILSDLYINNTIVTKIMNSEKCS